VHRGLEKLVEIRDFRQMIQIVERVCGICSMIHALIYCQALEELMGVLPPPRARFLRVIWSELHRLHSHLLWLGLFADAMGFESLFMQLWKVRERIMDINEATTGNRVIISVNVIGGVRRDLDPAQTGWILSQLAQVEKEINAVSRTILHDYTVQKRTRGKGVLSRDQAMELGCAGPTMRGSGVAQDMRMLGYAAYGELDFAPVVEQDGDCYARSRVRFREVGQSIGLIRQAIDKLPFGDTSVPVKGRPEGEIVARAEQPRGECLYYIKANGGKFLAIDPCISCTER
jgi:ech hydrogenase subunit E